MKISEISQSPVSASYKTVANGESFVRDVFRALGGINGVKDQTLNITVTLKGSNVLEYSITKVEK